MERQNEVFEQFVDEVSGFLLSDTGHLYLEFMLREHSSLLNVAERVKNDKVNEEYAVKMDVYSGQGHIDLSTEVASDIKEQYEDQQFLNNSI